MTELCFTLQLQLRVEMSDGIMVMSSPSKTHGLSGSSHRSPLLSWVVSYPGKFGESGGDGVLNELLGEMGGTKQIMAPTTLPVNLLCPQEAYNLSRKTGYMRKPTLLIFPLGSATKDLNKWFLTRNDFLMDRVSQNMMMPRGDTVCTA